MAAMSTLQAVMDDRLWDVVQMDLPAWFLAPVFKVLFSSRDVFDEISASCPFSFASGLLELLNSSTAPSLNFFKSLPSSSHKELRKHWGVYAHIYEKDGRKPRLYIGSGTNERDGVGARLENYNEPYNTLPLCVLRAIQQGFRKTHTTLLCWSNTPAAGIVPRIRQRYLGMEGIFQMIFFASNYNVMEPTWSPLVPWSREDVEWEPLCTHVSLNERCVGDLNISAEDLERLAVDRRQRRAENSLRSSRKHRVSRAIREKESLKNTKALGIHKCSPCNKTFTKPFLLKRHETSDVHKENVATIASGGIVQPSAAALLAAKRATQARADKQHFCDMCEKAFGRRSHLERHYGTQLHLDKAAVADAAICYTDSDSDSDSDSSDPDETGHSMDLF
jgi:ribosomal protein L37AE/L43A